jgi:rod shape-determining protein MreC
MVVHRKFTQTRFFQALIIFLVLWIFVSFGPTWLIAPLRTSVATVTLPFQKIFSVTAFELGDIYRFFSSIGELKSENERLEKERLQLLVENARYADVSKENDELRKEIGLLPRDKFSLKAATVIGRDVSGMGNWISIDQGSLDGITNGMSVIVDKGVLIGRVVEIFPSNARVMLLSNPESLVSGIALDTEATGIVRGEYGLGFLFDMVLQTDTLTVGDSIMTSGLGGDVPRGLLIGTLQDVHLSNDRLFQQASVVSPVRFDRIRYVFVIQNMR